MERLCRTWFMPSKQPSGRPLAKARTIFLNTSLWLDLTTWTLPKRKQAPYRSRISRCFQWKRAIWQTKGLLRRWGSPTSFVGLSINIDVLPSSPSFPQIHAHAFGNYSIYTIYKLRPSYTSQFHLHILCTHICNAFHNLWIERMQQDELRTLRGVEASCWGVSRTNEILPIQLWLERNEEIVKIQRAYEEVSWHHNR